MIYSDHQPLKHLLSVFLPIPPMASSHIQCWALLLSAVNFKPGKDQGNAERLSHLLLPETLTCTGNVAQVIARLETTMVKVSQINPWTDRGSVLPKVKRSVMSSLLNSMDNEELLPYVQQKNKISIQDSCLLWGNSIIIPSQGHN